MTPDKNALMSNRPFCSTLWLLFWKSAFFFLYSLINLSDSGQLALRMTAYAKKKKEKKLIPNAAFQ